MHSMILELTEHFSSAGIFCLASSVSHIVVEKFGPLFYTLLHLSSFTEGFRYFVQLSEDPSTAFLVGCGLDFDGTIATP